MSVLEYVIGVILILTAVGLVIAVLMQEGKSKNLSGAIAGGAETFVGKSRSKKISPVLSKLTSIVSVAFVLVILALFIAQPNGNKVDYSILKKVDDSFTRVEETTTDDETSSAETEEETEAETDTDTSTESETQESDTETE